ncbi:MAG: hypothetical protein BM558_00380 [Roseobacter sp. MedPE-SW]|nr:MAG: hypothetical protein BM558_00380 [Roseobacter sp. MedPE-SW]
MARMGVSSSNRLVSFARVIRPVCGDTAGALIGWDLFQEFGQHGRIADVAPQDLDRANLQRQTSLNGMRRDPAALRRQLSRWVHKVHPIRPFVQQSLQGG